MSVCLRPDLSSSHERRTAPASLELTPAQRLLPVEMLRHEVRGDLVIELDRLSVSVDGSVVDMLKVFVARGRFLTRSEICQI